jgi:hypothetical protein
MPNPKTNVIEFILRQVFIKRARMVLLHQRAHKNVQAQRRRTAQPGIHACVEFWFESMIRGAGGRGGGGGGGG